jgi:amino acid transporter
MASDVRQEGPGAAQLGEHRLSFFDAVAQSIGFMGPVFGAAFLTFLVAGAGNAGKGAGAATPLAILFALIGMGAIAWMVAVFARRIRAAGSLYDYVTYAFGNHAGFVAGWIYYLGVLILAVNAILFMGGLLSDYLAGFYKISVPYWILGLVIIAGLFPLLYFGVKISTRSQLFLAGTSMILVLAFAISIIINGGPQGNTIKPFTVGAADQGWSGIFFGLLYAILIFTGFETAANLAEETRDPRRNIPRAVLWALGLVGVYFLVITYSYSIGLGLNGKAWAQDPAVLITLGSSPQYGSSLIAKGLFAIALADLAAVCLGCTVACSHGLFALARDRRLPKGLARSSPRFGTPSVGIVVTLLLAAALIVVTRLTNGEWFGAFHPTQFKLEEFFPVFLWLAGLGSFCLVAVYLAISVGGLFKLWGKENKVGLAIAGLVGLAVSVGAIFGTVYKAPKIPARADTLWIAMLVWFVLGLLWLAGLVATRRLQPAYSTLAEPVTPAPAQAVPAAPPPPVPPPAGPWMEP